MKASELIVTLQKLIDEHGDLPVATYCDEWDRWDPISGTVVFVEAQEGRGTPGTYTYMHPTGPMIGV